MIFEEDIKECLKVLKKGGLILYPTDTIWGIGADATNEKAVAKIYALKKRNEAKSMIILLADENDILTYSAETHPTVFDFIKGVRKPVTVVYRNAKNLAPNIINEDGSIGMRVVKNGFAKTLVEKFGKPVVSTSANLSGYPPPGNFGDIDIEIKKAVDYIVQHLQDDTSLATPSTVVTVDNKGEIIILRH
ncbi:MAG: L-threonylcarbamoyladenylate synthase [Ferruginibacter sp.]